MLAIIAIPLVRPGMRGETPDGRLLRRAFRGWAEGLVRD
jgi:hypothetical protein